VVAGKGIIVKVVEHLFREVGTDAVKDLGKDATKDLVKETAKDVGKSSLSLNPPSFIE
jgi:hypothetical protein